MNKELEELRLKYIGEKVYAGSRMKGYYGTITDIVPDEDGCPEYWFIVARDNYTAGCGEPRFQKWSKHELKQVVITTKLVPLFND